mgnify:CR=1 FL=1|jgi:hypothetical protein
MLQSYTSSEQNISILEELLGEKEAVRKWYEKIWCLFCCYKQKQTR